jgi:hypothetical protein
MCTTRFAGSEFGLAPSNPQTPKRAPNNTLSLLQSVFTDVKNCIDNVALPTIANDLNPIPTDSVPGLIGSLQSGADSASQSFMLAAGTYSVGKGLTAPLRSSIVRAGVADAEALGEASGVLAMGTVVYALGDAIIAEYQQCQ